MVSFKLSLTALLIFAISISVSVLFVDYGNVGVVVKLFKWKWSNTIGNRKEAVN